MAASIQVLQARELGSLVPEWEALAARALEPNPFYEPWLLLPALQLFDQKNALFLALREGGTLVGFLPLQRQRGFRGLPVSTLVSWRHAHCLLCTPLVDRDCLPALREWGGAALLELKYFPAGGPLDAALAGATTLDRYERAILRKAPDAERYLENNLSSELRRRVRRYEKQLRSRGRLEYRVLGANEDTARWIDDFMTLEAGGWKGRQRSALASSEANRRFAREALQGAAQRGRLLMSGIDFEGVPIARRCSFLAGEGAYAWKTAYDEAFAEYSPGVLAEVHNIRVLHALPGTRWMDSFTGAGNAMIDRLWKDRVGVRSAAVSLTPTGTLALQVLPVFRTIKRFCSQFRTRKSGAARAPCTTAASP